MQTGTVITAYGLRSSPSGDHTEQPLNIGDQVEIIGCDAGWMWVRTSRYAGFVPSNKIKVEPDKADEPAAPEPQPPAATVHKPADKPALHKAPAKRPTHHR